MAWSFKGRADIDKGVAASIGSLRVQGSRQRGSPSFSSPPHYLIRPSAPVLESAFPLRSSVQLPNMSASSGVTPDTLKALLEEKVGAVHVEIADLSGTYPHAFLHPCYSLNALFPLGGCGQMFEAIIVSPQFEKKTTLARHRLVNAALKEQIAAIHAWTPKCHTPEEWEKKKAQA